MMVLTADASPETKQTALTSGANDFLTKPFQHLEVLARVANLLETRRLHLELARHSEKLEEEVSARTKELRETEGRLFQSQKMDAVGQLAGGIAHDFNNLLAVIINYAILLLEDMDPDDPQREDVSEIQRAGESAATLTRQLLAFSRKEVVRSVVLDLNKVVRGVEKLLHRTIGENIEFVVDLDDVHPTKLDPGQLEQVLLNLAVNARDAMPDGGRLSIRGANTVIKESGVEALAVPAGAWVRVDVTDTGTGIEDGLLGQIFEPFFTTKGQTGGTGLGLATVYGTVSQAGGHVRVRSQIGEGTSFSLFFPRVVAADAPPTTPAPSRQLPHATGTETILIIEDEASVRDVTVKLLTRLGYRVLAAVDGADGVERAAAHPGQIDLILSDLVMPELGGADAVARIRLLRPDVPVIFISGYSEEALHWQTGAPSGGRLLSKPFSIEDLARAVRISLDRA
jgi:hypothetical protein